MVEEEELGIAFCTRAKMRRKEELRWHILLQQGARDHGVDVLHEE